MEILFTECSIVSVLPADWSKSPDWGCCTPTVFLPRSIFGAISVLATIYSYRFFSIYITIGVNSSYFQILLQFHHICFYSRWSTFSIFQISLQFHHICFYFRWSTFFIFQILLQFLRICFYSLWSIILIFQILLQITYPARITMRSYLLQIFHKSFLL